MTKISRTASHIQSFALKGINKGLCIGNIIIGERKENNFGTISQQGLRGVLGAPVGLMAAATFGVAGGLLGLGYAVSTGLGNSIFGASDETKNASLKVSDDLYKNPNNG